MNNFKIFFCSFLFCLQAFAQTNDTKIEISTDSNQLIYRVDENKNLRLDYYGEKLNNLENLYDSGVETNVPAYPAFGVPEPYGKMTTDGVMCVRTKHTDGNISLKLKYQSHKTTQLDENSTQTVIKLKDEHYPFYVDISIKAFESEDILEMSTRIVHQEKEAIPLYNFASAFLSFHAKDYWLTSLQGTWGHEANMYEEKLNHGIKSIENMAGARNSQTENPSFMISLDQAPSEDTGNVIAASLAYTGNYKMAFQIKQYNKLSISAGINPMGSEYLLEQGEVFETPPLLLTYSTKGKGQASRNFHDYARKYRLVEGDKERKILLNSWEGVYFTFTEEDIVQMIDDIASIGGELFVLDDGWFGKGKYERNNGKTGLGDWQISKRKLPHGIDYLIDAAKERGIDFGIWVEPGMVNTESELYNKHPDWIFYNPKREIQKGRGGTQVVLDLTNPEVQDFVFNTVNDLLEDYPRLDYIKWDANKDIGNYGSNFLPKDKQSHIFIEYQRGLNTVLERLRDNHPTTTIQVCASGGGRINYGFLPYFSEFWTSDNTDALKRIYMQWGVSNFYPAIAMASHVSAEKNHQTGRVIPLKFRFDVAMTGRLGMELQPKDMSEEELKFSKNAIEAYKSIRPIVQFGNLYRIISPYEGKHVASLAYVDDQKNNAAFYAFHLTMNNTEMQIFPAFKVKGLDADKNYRVTEINKENKNTFKGDGKVYSGNYLMDVGLKMNFKREYTSVVLKLEAVD